MARDPEQLTLREELFVSAYLACHNATEAAKAAGYSAKTAYAKGSDLLKRPRVAKALEAAKKRILHKYEIATERTLQEMAAIGYADIRHYSIDKHGMVVLAPGAPETAMRAVKRVKRRARVEFVGKGKRKRAVVVYDTEFELWSKDQQLRNIGEHLKLFKENRGGDAPPTDPDDELTPEQRNERIVALLRVAMKRKQEATGGPKKAG